MIAISFKFTSGRFHATPWGRHVNEGMVEWPPSPWRILRALLATGYNKLGWNRQNVQSAAITLFDKLAALPTYYLPPASLGHARYFMPAPETRTKIFDAFVAVSPEEPLFAVWQNTELLPEEELLLKKLLLSLSYLGRAESRVSAEMVNNWDGIVNCKPLEGLEKREGRHMRLLVAKATNDFVAWRSGFLDSNASVAKGQKGSKDMVTVPETVWDALHADTGMLQKEGWSAPPGSRWVEYCGPQELFSVENQTVRSTDFRPTVARYALSGSVLPLLTDALFLGERMRQALMSNSRKLSGAVHAHSVFSGKTEDGQPSKSLHTHAFFLPSDQDNDGRIDHITVYASDGFDDIAQQSLSAVRKLWSNSGHDIYLALVGLGEPATYGGFNVNAGLSLQLAISNVWESTTPFVLTRHLKTKRSERHDPAIYAASYTRELEKALVKELKRSRKDLPSIAKIQCIPAHKMNGKSIPWHKFKRQRVNGGGKQASLRGHGFRITFTDPVKGPLVAGYGCHFGLGQFAAVDTGI